jgi:NhaP-type Na+/H+ or K+/H+ antiporter
MLDPEFYPLLLAGVGALALLVAWLPLILRRLPLSLPILCVGLGAGLSSIPGVPAFPDPLAPSAFAEHLAELTVLISLMGAGLKLDRNLSFRGWRVTWRLLGITMPVSIIALMLIAWGMLGFAIGTALLIGAALAPTDPVLASDVQVGPPGVGETDEVRFSLTSEAGLNDALAFPFVLLALGIAGPNQTWFMHWLGVDVFLRIAIGAAIGWASGWLVGWLAFDIPKIAQLARTREGFVSLALTFLTYGLAELAGGYGFISVFLAAISLRRTERGHEYFQTLYGFSQSIEHLLTMVVLLLLGSALAHDLLHAPAVAGCGVRRTCRVAGPPAGRATRSGGAAPLDQRPSVALGREADHQLLRHSRYRLDLLPDLRTQPAGLATEAATAGDHWPRRPALDRAARHQRDTADGLARPPARGAPGSAPLHDTGRLRAAPSVAAP